jgi:hypothetical protein
VINMKTAKSLGINISGNVLSGTFAITGSLRLYVRELNRLRPFLSVFSDEPSEISGGTWKHCCTKIGKTCSHFQISFLLLGKFGDGKVIVLSPSPRPALMTKAEFQAVSDGQEKGGKKYLAKVTPTLVNSTEKPGDVEATHRASAFGARCQSASRFQPRQQRAADVGCHDPPRAVRMTRSFS